MYSLFLQNWFGQALIKTIGWTLVHSLWQGLLITLIAGALIVLTRRSRPALRYNLLTGLFFIFLLTSLITFIIQWQQYMPGSRAAIEPVASQPVETMISVTANPISPDASVLSLEGFRQYFNMNASVFVLGWFLIFLLKSVRLAGNLNHVRLMRRHNKKVGQAWQDRVAQMAVHLGIDRAVLLFESATVKVPVVIGMLKPVILLPIGVLANLPSEQVEAILLHELAHIRRRDYLVNIVQCFAETIFFFNPAMWWLSSQIREEREICCDDIALGIIHNKPAYIHALMAFQENRHWKSRETAAVTPAFPGKKHHLLNRVKRIVYNNNKNLNSMEKFFLAGGLVVAGIVALAFTTDKPVATANKKIEITVQRNITVNGDTRHPLPDTPRKKSTFVTNVEGKDYKIVLNDDAVSELYVDGQMIPAEKYGEYKPIIDKIIIEAKIQAAKAREEAERSKKEASIAKVKAAESKRAEQMARQEELRAKKEADKSKKEAEKSKKEAELSSVQRLTKSRVVDKMDREKRIEEKHGRMEDKIKDKKKESGEEAAREEKKERMKENQKELKERQKAQHKEMEKVRREKMKNKEEMENNRKEALKESKEERAQMEKERKQAAKQSEEQRRTQKEKEQRNNQIEKEVEKQIDKQRETKRREKDEKEKTGPKQPEKPKPAVGPMTGSEMTLTKAGNGMTLQSNKLFGNAASIESVKSNNGILNDLVSEKVVTDWYRLTRITITLNRKELVVNGVKQPESLHAKLAQKYLPKHGDASVTYSFHKDEQ
jgi:bla regulator protein blaR1